MVFNSKLAEEHLKWKNKKLRDNKERMDMRALKCSVCGKKASGIINCKPFCNKHFIRNRRRQNIYYGRQKSKREEIKNAEKD